MRLEPMAKRGDNGEGPFAELQDGRMVCMTCAKVWLLSSASRGLRPVSTWLARSNDSSVPFPLQYYFRKGVFTLTLLKLR